jgi:hypothetical protein
MFPTLEIGLAFELLSKPSITNIAAIGHIVAAARMNTTHIIAIWE